MERENKIYSPFGVLLIGLCEDEWPGLCPEDDGKRIVSKKEGAKRRETVAAEEWASAELEGWEGVVLVSRSNILYRWASFSTHSLKWVNSGLSTRGEPRDWSLANNASTY